MHANAACKKFKLYISLLNADFLAKNSLNSRNIYMNWNAAMSAKVGAQINEYLTAELKLIKALRCSYGGYSRSAPAVFHAICELIWADSSVSRLDRCCILQNYITPLHCHSFPAKLCWDLCPHLDIDSSLIPSQSDFYTKINDQISIVRSHTEPNPSNAFKKKKRHKNNDKTATCAFESLSLLCILCTEIFWL